MFIRLLFQAQLQPYLLQEGPTTTLLLKLAFLPLLCSLRSHVSGAAQSALLSVSAHHYIQRTPSSACHQYPKCRVYFYTCCPG